MKPAVHYRKVLLIFLLLGFIFSACSTTKSSVPHSDGSQDESPGDVTFQEYLWGQHSLDLLIQVGLLLAGAFGVVVLLPAPNEE
ncbi:MAG TPA: hypothetical protein DCK95_04360 [Anaerolineaceae bacterium]|nr:hypothetical protein [Anaerolineaceae bacterium]